jgi:hypothetical protein
VSAIGRRPGAVAAARVINALHVIAVGSYRFLAYTPLAYWRMIQAELTALAALYQDQPERP